MVSVLIRPLRTFAFTFVFMIGCLLVTDCRADSDLQRVTQNFRIALIAAPPWPTKPYKAEKAFETLRTDGSWADQDYNDRDRIHWKAIDHLPRLLSIVRAYYQPGNSLSGKPVVLARSITALKYWLDNDPKNENWWHNEIGVPNLTGEILMVLGKDAPDDLRTRGIELMKRAKWEKQTGANLTDETRIQVMRGCLSGSTDLVSQAYERSWKEVRLAAEREDGMQVDHSFHQHGPLLYCQGYGAVFVDDVVQFVEYASGTQFQIPDAERELFTAYLLGGPQWMIRGGKWDFGACGRGICRPGDLNAAQTPALEKIAGLPGNGQQELQAIVARLKNSDDESAPVGNRQYWLSDYMAHRRPNYFASARMFSTRTLNTDGLTNGENRKSHHMADGATCLMVSGNEYFDIFPVWDWMRIPGTTIEQNTPLVPKDVSHKGKNSFAGEVSDGSYGCSSMQLISGKLTAKKSWFFFDNEVVCLGTDINCPAQNHVFTSLNQCLLNGPVEYSDGALSGGDHNLNRARWFWHDSIGYVFPQPTDVHVKNQSQSGTWADIGSGSAEPVSKNVFSLWIDHGSLVADGSYAYVLVPGSTAKQTMAEAANLPVKILSNTPNLQAVWHGQLNLLEAVFHAPGNLNVDGMVIAVDQPCLLLMKRGAAKLELAVSNPENRGGTVSIALSIVEHGNGAKQADKGTTIQIELPGGLQAGSTAVRELTFGE